MVQRFNSKWGHKVSNELEIKTSKKDVPVEDATSLIYNVNLSINQYQKLRTSLQHHAIDLPPRNKIDSYKKTLMCEFKVESTKTSCEFNVLVTDTVKSLLAIHSAAALSDGDSVHVEGKLGIDGSGSHNVRHQLVER